MMLTSENQETGFEIRLMGCGRRQVSFDVE